MTKTLLAPLLAASLALEGCHAVIPIEVHVEDALTGQPVSSADVILYPMTVFDLTCPHGDSGRVDNQGDLLLHVSDYPLYHVQAIDSAHEVSSGTIRGIGIGRQIETDQGSISILRQAGDFNHPRARILVRLTPQTSTSPPLNEQ